jgi:hypothetical protein
VELVCNSPGIVIAFGIAASTVLGRFEIRSICAAPDLAERSSADNFSDPYHMAVGLDFGGRSRCSTEFVQCLLRAELIGDDHGGIADLADAQVDLSTGQVLVGRARNERGQQATK